MARMACPKGGRIPGWTKVGKKRTIAGEFFEEIWVSEKSWAGYQPLLRGGYMATKLRKGTVPAGRSLGVFGSKTKARKSVTDWMCKHPRG